MTPKENGPPHLPPRLVERLRDVRSVGAITGAGVSRGSGLPTYRGKGGIYDDPDEGDRTVEALSGPTLAVDPDRTWRAVVKLARQAQDAHPSAAHRALAGIERVAERFVLLTQNVDGLHQAAGSRHVIDIHGDVLATRCLSCASEGRLERDVLLALEEAPRCPACGGVLRPGAVLFGEMLPADKVERMVEEFHRNVPDMVLIVGTSAMFPYITEPVFTAVARGKLTVEVNPEATPTSNLVEFSLRGEADVFLPLIEFALTRASPEHLP
jgi:NAD-dependent deacetylase